MAKIRRTGSSRKNGRGRGGRGGRGGRANGRGVRAEDTGIDEARSRPTRDRPARSRGNGRTRRNDRPVKITKKYVGQQMGE